MTDETPKKRPMSEIGHLFLSNVRDMHANGQGRPKRTPPGGPRQPDSNQPPVAGTPGPLDPSLPPGGAVGPAYRPDLSIDLTPEEFAEVFAERRAAPDCEDEDAAAPPERPAPPVAALIAAHLNGKQLDRCREFARHLAARGERVGLIELDGSEFRISCFERAVQPAVSNGNAPDGPLVPTDCCDPRQMAEAVEELNHDVDRWLLLLPNPRLPEAKALLRLVDRWTLLSTCDHDGIVASYRTLKGLSDLHRPRLSLALLDTATQDAEQDVIRVYRKLSGVCEQFLDWHLELEPEPAVRRTHRVTEHLVLVHRPHHDKAQMANPVQWPVVADFLARAKAAAERQQQAALTHQSAAGDVETPDDTTEPESNAFAPVRELVGDVVIPTTAPETTQATKEAPLPQTQPADVAVVAPVPSAAMPTATPAPHAAEQVLDLADPQGTPGAILSAVLHGGAPCATDFVECPVRAPMCDDARLAVGRDRSLVLFAVARQGLTDLRSIGHAYRWLRENLSLIGMAVPQFAIDTQQTPRLRLLVDHGDMSAEVLQPMLQTDHVTVQSYRKLRWGGKTGLLLEAA